MDGEEATDVVAAGRGKNSSVKQEQQQAKTSHQNTSSNEENHLATDQDELLSIINELNGLFPRGQPKQQGLSAAGGREDGDPKKAKGENVNVSEEVDLLCPTSSARHLLLSLSIAEY